MAASGVAALLLTTLYRAGGLGHSAATQPDHADLRVQVYCSGHTSSEKLKRNQPESCSLKPGCDCLPTGVGGRFQVVRGLARLHLDFGLHWRYSQAPKRPAVSSQCFSETPNTTVGLCYPQMLPVHSNQPRIKSVPQTPSVLNTFGLPLIIILHADGRTAIYTAVRV